MRFARARSGSAAEPRAPAAGRAAALAGAERPPASAALALLGDKRFLFSDSGRSFIMYGVQGRSWIAMGEPIGAGRRASRAAVAVSRALRSPGAAAPCSTRSGPTIMPDLVELGLTFYKLGEQAFVPLAGFSLDGADALRPAAGAAPGRARRRRVRGRPARAASAS